MMREFGIILLINYIGIFISSFLNIPIPGSIVGMLLLLFLLYFKIINLKLIENVSTLILANMGIFFIPPTMRILDLMHLIKGDFIKIIILMMLTTFITMGVTGKIVDVLIKVMNRNGVKNDGHND